MSNTDISDVNQLVEEQSLVKEIGEAGAFWIANKKVTAFLGLEETIILMEHVSTYSSLRKKKLIKQDGWFFRSKNDLIAVLPCGATGIQQKENKLIELKLIIKEQKNPKRMNHYRVQVQNILEFVKNPYKYIKNINADLLSGNAKRKAHYLNQSDASKNDALSVGKRRYIKNTLKETVLFLRKRINPQPTAAVPLRCTAGYGEETSPYKGNTTLDSRSNLLNNESKAAPVSNRDSIKQGLIDSMNKPVAKVTGHRKVNKNTLDIVEYWNSLPGLRTHNLIVTDGKYLLDKQTKAVQEINDHILRLLRGELYHTSTDIIQPVVRTMKFSVDSIKKAIMRASKGTAIEFGGSAKKMSLTSFFYNPHSFVYPENGKSMYKYKYPFLYYINGDLQPIVPKIKGDSENGITALVLRKFKAEGFSISAKDRGNVGRAVDVAMKVFFSTKSRWKQSEMEMMTEFPHILFSCHRHCANNPNDINDLWYVATYKFEQHLKDKRYI